LQLPHEKTHQNSEQEIEHKKRKISALVGDTFSEKHHIEWETQTQITSLG